MHVLFLRYTLVGISRWVKNLRHGEGTLLHADGSIFKGTFSRDKKMGSGTVISLGGSSYEGTRAYEVFMGIDRCMNTSAYEPFTMDMFPIQRGTHA